MSVTTRMVKIMVIRRHQQCTERTRGAALMMVTPCQDPDRRMEGERRRRMRMKYPRSIRRKWIGSSSISWETSARIVGAPSTTPHVGILTDKLPLPHPSPLYWSHLVDATDAKGEAIHQTLMAREMQRLDESPDFRPFKFRIGAFTNAFLEEVGRAAATE